MRITISLAEAERICKQVFEKLSPNVDYDEALSAEARAQAALGTFYIVESLQDLGYRIAAPLVLARKEGEED